MTSLRFVTEEGSDKTPSCGVAVSGNMAAVECGRDQDNICARPDFFRNVFVSLLQSKICAA